MWSYSAMATGGTAVRRFLHGRMRGICTPLPDRAVAEAPTLLALTLFLGCYLRIRQRWFIPGYSGFGYTTWVVQTTVDGRAIAPNQYRVLMPWVDEFLARATGLPLPTAILLSDLVLLVLAVLLLRRLAVRTGSHHWLLGAAAAWAYWVAKLDQWHPEIMLLTVVVTAVVLILSADDPGPMRLLGLGVMTCAVRTDYAVGLGVVVLAVGLVKRRTVVSCAGSAILATAVVTTWTLPQVFPAAHYAVDVIQLPFNLTPGSLVLVLTFYGPVLALPAIAMLRGNRAPAIWIAALWFIIEFGLVFVVGRTDESRIFMPLAPALGIAAVAAWRRLADGLAASASPERTPSAAPDAAVDRTSRREPSLAGGASPGQT